LPRPLYVPLVIGIYSY